MKAAVKAKVVKVPIPVIKKNKPKTVWFTKDDEDADYRVWAKKPTWDQCWNGNDCIDYLCQEVFEEITDYELPGGFNSIIEVTFPTLKD